MISFSCGKTSLARLLAKQTDATFRELSATVVGISDVRAVFEEAKGTLSLTRRYLLQLTSLFAVIRLNIYVETNSAIFGRSSSF